MPNLWVFYDNFQQVEREPQKHIFSVNLFPQFKIVSESKGVKEKREGRKKDEKKKRNRVLEHTLHWTFNFSLSKCFFHKEKPVLIDYAHPTISPRHYNRQQGRVNNKFLQRNLSFVIVSTSFIHV